MAKKYVFAVDIGGTITKVGLFDLNYKIVKKISFRTKYCRNKDSLIETIISQFYRVLQSKKIPVKSILSIGIGIPGLVDHRGVVYGLTNIPGWENVPLARIIQRRLKIPTFVNNDGNLTALGEWRLGKGRGHRNLICLTLGTGVGSGIIVAGKLFQGSRFSAAEIGHIPLGRKGEKCNCGGEACLETYVGNSYLSEIARREIKKGRNSLLKKLTQGNLENITPLRLNQAAKRGEVLSREIWEEAGQRIGLVLAGVVNVFNPELIIVAGGVSLAGEFILSGLQRTLKNHVMKGYRKNLKVVPARFRKDAGLIGAAILAKEGKNVIRGKN